MFANIHAEAASGGQTAVPTDLKTNLHFTCFVRAPSVRGPGSPGGYRIIELDGRRGGPIDRGECNDLLTVSVYHTIDRANSTENNLRTQQKSSRISTLPILQATSLAWLRSVLHQLDDFKEYFVFLVIHGISCRPSITLSNQSLSIQC